MQPQFIQLKKKWDPRRFKIHKDKTVGVFPISQVPNTFSVGEPPRIKNQLTTPFCSAFSSSYILDAKLGIETSPEYIIQKEVLVGNYDPKTINGVDIDTVYRTFCRYGSIPQEKSPYTVGKDDPSIIADPTKWDPNIDSFAQAPFGSSFEVTKKGYIDLFDAARATMFTTKKWLHCAAYFIQEWMYAPKGIIPSSFPRQEVNGHMFCACGVEEINGVLYLKIPNSWGVDMGGMVSQGIVIEKGGYYFAPREAVNTFFDISIELDRNPNDAKQEQWNILQKIFDKLMTILRILQGRATISSLWKA